MDTRTDQVDWTSQFHMQETDRERERRYHRMALEVLARGAEERLPIANGSGPIPAFLFVRTFTLLLVGDPPC
jgi:hypothetical protein